MNREDFYENTAKHLPLTPGCYMFLDKEGNVLYIGKSKCLKKRVASYFGNVKFEKLGVMLRFAKSIAIEETGTDIEALLLEHKLIKKHRPQYNAKMRKDYQHWYVKIDDCILVTLEADPHGFFVGPFSHKESAVEVLEILGKCFKLPTCNKSANQVARMCLRGQMKNCFAPCENKGKGVENYKHAMRFLKGNHEEVLEGIQIKMRLAVENMEYEKAAEHKALHEELKQLSSFAANSAPILAGKRFVVYLKSRHEDCFMLAYLDDGECFAKVLLDGMHETDKIHDFAKVVCLINAATCRPKNEIFSSIEESKAFARALVEISAIRRFYEITPTRQRR